MSEYDKPPIEDDLRHDDAEFNPALEPQSAKAWLNLLQESEDAFENWNHHCDNIDRQFAHLGRLSELNRTKQFQMFWANLEVIKPAIYAKAPIPVVVPKFKDRRPVYQQASEIMERCCTVAFDLTRINDLMLLVRDDVAMTSRGVAWCRYESAGDGYYASERVCVDFKGRRDFLHSISRNWREVTWVAAASYLTRSEARERFRKYSGDAYQQAEYKVDKDSKNVGGADNRERAKFWEIWSRGSKRVCWVAEGVEDILDEDKAHLDLQNFFPCPKPAYGSVQPGSLIPVPDVMQYRDQLEEVNLLTGRIHALSDAVEMKGFYPAGGEAAEAIQTAIATKTAGVTIVPIANFASFGGTKEPILWMPIEQIAATITALVMLRKQVIDDIYQITGMADIMRGDTDPQETLGAQQLKTQYGSSRIRDKQGELARLARDLVEITSEIITEKFDDATMIEMSQTQLPQQKDVERQMEQLSQQMMQIQQHMQMQPPQQPPQPGQPPQGGGQEQLQQAMQQMMQEMQKLQQQPTIEQVLRFLKDNRAKSFVLDIETDSTIIADENAEKQRRTEFMQVMGGLMQQLGQLIAADPSAAPLCGDLLKFGTAPFRVGRSLEGSIDEYVEQVKARGAQGKGDDPTTAMGKIQLQIEQMKQATAQQKIAQDMQIAQAKLAQDDTHKQAELANQRQIAQMKMSGDSQDAQVDMAVQGQKMQESREAHQAQLVANAQKMEIERKKAQLAVQTHMMKAQATQQTAALKAQQRPTGPI